ncbi:LysE family translocator [Pseudomonas sp. LRF_L74]|uniref:LysE family translocator n=1 Tax=Pseudomonas sp. LRF_L74 TaxID=3369422 RepID=UPI003F5EAC80
MFTLFVLVASTHFAALLSPGPDFFLLLRNALLRGRAQANGNAFGIALANLLSMLLVVLALELLPPGESGLWRLLQGLGGCYFVWLGLQALRARRELRLIANDGREEGGHWREGVWQGLLASSLNPKLPIFYAGLFTLLREASMPAWGTALCMAWMSAVVLFWDLLLVRLLSHARWRDWLEEQVVWLDRSCGALLLGLGLALVCRAMGTLLRGA